MVNRYNLQKVLMNKKLLFEPFRLGDITLRNRIVMSAMTRSRADYKTGLATDLHRQYYEQRASAGLILTECMYVDWRGNGYPGAPGLTNKEQAESWKKVTKAVHDKGGVIFAQLYHSGRIGHPNYTGLNPVGPSRVEIRDQIRIFTGKGMDDPVLCDEMTVKDIKEVEDKFEAAAKFAQEAGFDGIEIHAANGYLLDNFLRDETNRRTDEYGGSIEKRCKFPLNVIDRTIKVWGSKRVGIKVSPVGRFNGMYDSNPKALFNYLTKELDKRDLGYICFFEYDGWPKTPFGPGTDQIPNCAKEFKPLTKVPIMTTGGNVTVEEGIKRLEEKIAELVCFAKPFISNPDLVERIKNDWPLAMANDKQFYTPGPEGYIDYPAYNPKSL